MTTPTNHFIHLLERSGEHIHKNARPRTPPTTTRYGEHTTGIPPTMMHYLADASLKQSPAQGRAQSGGDDQEVMNQQQGPATQFMEEQGRSTRHLIRQSDHTHHGITTHDL